MLTSRGLRTVRIGYAYQPPAYLPAYRGTTGAGPAGLHMASRLKQLGCTNVTILERTFRYGGKTHTVHEYGNPNDIGTCWMLGPIHLRTKIGQTFVPPKRLK